MHCLGCKWPTWMLTLSYFFLTTIMEGEQKHVLEQHFSDFAFLGLQGYQQKGRFRLGLVCWSFHHTLKVADNLSLNWSDPPVDWKTAKKATPKPQSDVSRKMHHVPYDFFIRFPVCMANVVRGCCWQLPYACSRNTPWSSQHVRRPVWQLAGEEKRQVFLSVFFRLKRHKILEIWRGSGICNVPIFSCCFFFVQGLVYVFFFLIHSIPKNSCSFGQGPDTNKNPASSNKAVTPDLTSWEV